MDEFFEVFPETNIDREFLEKKLAIDPWEFLFENGRFQDAVIQSQYECFFTLVIFGLQQSLLLGL